MGLSGYPALVIGLIPDIHQKCHARIPDIWFWISVGHISGWTQILIFDRVPDIKSIGLLILDIF